MVDLFVHSYVCALICQTEGLNGVLAFMVNG